MIRILIPLLLLILPMTVYGDPGNSDTLTIDTVSGSPGTSVVVPVNFYNDEVLSAVQTVLAYDDDYLTLDSFSLVGSRLESFADLNIAWVDSGGTFDIFMFDLYQTIDIGQGLLYNLYFTISNDAPEGTYPIDTTTRVKYHDPYPPTYLYTNFVDETASTEIIPEVKTGSIKVLPGPGVADSIWVENVTTDRDRTINVDIYGFNSKPVDTVNLALTFPFDQLTFNQAVFDGTRSSTAFSKIVNMNTDLEQLLITLIFSQANPLDTGTGTLATLEFYVPETAEYGEVVIDSTSFLGAQSLEISPMAGDNYTPFFTPGLITISNATDVNDSDNSLLPGTFTLRQNYPNPFNPSTTIEFDLPRATTVRIDVFNIAGQKVTTLVDDFLGAGSHTVIFEGQSANGSGLASGIYFYRMLTEDFKETKKMTLIK